MAPLRSYYLKREFIYQLFRILLLLLNNTINTILSIINYYYNGLYIDLFTLLV